MIFVLKQSKTLFCVKFDLVSICLFLTIHFNIALRFGPPPTVTCMWPLLKYECHCSRLAVKITKRRVSVSNVFN